MGLGRLKPAAAEASFWGSSTEPNSWLSRYDTCTAVLQLATNSLMFVKYGQRRGTYTNQPSTDPLSWLVEVMLVGPGFVCLYMALALTQLAWLHQRRPGGVYSRRRMALVVAGRLLRAASMTSLMLLVHSRGALPGSMVSELGAVATRSPVLAALKVLLVYSGAVHLALHNFMLLLPVASSMCLQLITLAVMVSVHAPLVLEYLQRPDVQPGACQIARSAVRAMLLMSGLHPFNPWVVVKADRAKGISSSNDGEDASCNPTLLWAAIVTAQMLCGYMLPLAASFMIECYLKRLWLQRLEQQQLEWRLAASGSTAGISASAAAADVRAAAPVAAGAAVTRPQQQHPAATTSGHSGHLAHVPPPPYPLSGRLPVLGTNAEFVQQVIQTAVGLLFCIFLMALIESIAPS